MKIKLKTPAPKGMKCQTIRFYKNETQFEVFPFTDDTMTDEEFITNFRRWMKHHPKGKIEIIHDTV